MERGIREEKGSLIPSPALRSILPGKTAYALVCPAKAGHYVDFVGPADAVLTIV